MLQTSGFEFHYHYRILLQGFRISLLLGLVSAQSQSQQPLKLLVSPPFIFVNENISIDKPLPNVNVCAEYTGAGTLSLLLSNGDPLGHFKLSRANGSCWEVILVKALDADQQNTDGSRGQTFTLSFRCTDGKAQAFGNLDIQVMDVNDSPPQFVDTPSQIFIPEDQDVGTLILSVKTFDPDTGVGGIDSFNLKDTHEDTFRIVNGSCSSFHCNADVYLNKELSYDYKSVYTLEIIAFDGAGRIATVNRVNFPVVVNVVDVENNPPTFLTDAGLRYVKEDTPVGAPVFQVEAIDGDTGVKDPNPIMYHLAGGEIGGRRFFGINATNGWVYVASPLDRESPLILQRNGAIAITIIAKEVTSAKPEPISTQNITIIIEDLDDEPPRCNLTSYVGEVMENSQSFIPVNFAHNMDLYVYDLDEGLNGEFSVSLEGDQGTFDVTPKVVFNEGNLLVRVRNSTALDYETTKTITFRVLLKGIAEGQKTGVCTVTVHLLDANDNPPSFNASIFGASIKENQPLGSAVTRIHATDIDTAKYLPIVYGISGTGSEKFLVDSNGTIRLREPLDRETVPKYDLTIIANDDGGKGNRGTAQMEITVLDENDNAPKFVEEVYIAYLAENSLSFAQLPNGFFVKATDADEPGSENARIIYEIDDTSPASRNFSIDPETGQISLIEPGVDIELMAPPVEYFNLTVFARDHGKPRPMTGQTIVFIFINDTNDNAPIFDAQHYNASVYETTSPDTIVIQVRAKDADRSPYNSQVAYRITNVQDKFVIDSQTGVVSVAPGASLDRDLNRQDIIKLNVVAVDQGFPQQSGSTTLSIRILDVNNKSPVFAEKIFAATIAEDRPIRTIVRNLVALDPDDTASLSYHLVRAESPIFGPSASLLASRKLNVSTMFAVDEATGILYTTGNLDREQLESVRLVVNVTDKNGKFNLPQTAQAFVDVTISDVNDNAPKFSQPVYSKSIHENAEQGTIILTVSAADPDKDTAIRYTLEHNPGALLKLNERTGELSVAGPIDFEELQWLNFSVIANDSGQPALTSRVPVFIEITDQNDNSPIFHPSPSFKLTIPEDTPMGTLAMQVNATDRDSGLYGQISFFLLTELGISPSFSVNETTGVLSVSGPLDRETKPSYTLTLQAVDDYTGHINPDSHEATGIINVIIEDVNDNAPIFASSTPKSILLNENNPAGMVVYTFSALDADDASNGNGAVTYSVIGGNATKISKKETFVINAITGVLSLARNLSGKYGVYELVIEARDQGAPISLAANFSLLIEVEDYNDHRPEIFQPLQDSVYSVAENNFTDFFVVVQIKARDADHGKNAEIRYSIKETMANEDWKYFSVDPISGNVYLKQALDYEKQKRFALTAKACDLGQPPLCDEIEFAVGVIDRDDNCPTFDRSVNLTDIIQIYENEAPGAYAGDIMAATDKDTAPENIHVCYEVIGGDGAPMFKLTKPNSTQVEALDTLDREQKDGYVLIIQANDCGRSAACHLPDINAANRKLQQLGSYNYDAFDKSLLYVQVEVLDVNDNPPIFTQRMFRGGAQYDNKLGSRVAKIRATDKDLMDRGHLRYYQAGPIKSQFTSGQLNTNREPFLLNSTTGDVITNILFQPTWKGTFEFAVYVNDSDGNKDTSVVSINLLSADQQVELIFGIPANQIWDDAAQIISLLSAVTISNATIDDVTPMDDVSRDARQQPISGRSKVLVHFVVPHSGDIMSVENALKAMDLPDTAKQKSAKQELITIYHLRYAGQNVEKVASAGIEQSLIFALIGVVGGAILILVVLVGIWVAQAKRYKRKLKAATTIAFGSSDPTTIPTILDVPGTNLHSGSNPVWNGHYGADNFAMHYDSNSNGSENSLDEHTLELHMDRSMPYESTTDQVCATLPKNNGFFAMNLGFKRAQDSSTASGKIERDSPNQEINKSGGGTIRDSGGGIFITSSNHVTNHVTAGSYNGAKGGLPRLLLDHQPSLSAANNNNNNNNNSNKSNGHTSSFFKAGEIPRPPPPPPLPPSAIQSKGGGNVSSSGNKENGHLPNGNSIIIDRTISPQPNFPNSVTLQSTEL